MGTLSWANKQGCAVKVSVHLVYSSAVAYTGKKMVPVILDTQQTDVLKLSEAQHCAKITFTFCYIMSSINIRQYDARCLS